MSCYGIMAGPPDLSRVTNFGENVAFSPRQVYSPTTENEVLRILNEHHGEKIRVVGRLHSWSEAPRADEVMLDLRHLNHVTLHEADSEVPSPGLSQRERELVVEVGAGCQIKRLLDELKRQANLTTPSVGLVTEQTIAGATATGTHGSGKHSLSHYVDQVRLATYDERTGKAVVKTVDAGGDLRAARCSLGAMGVVLAVRLKPRAMYRVEEFFAWHDTLDQVLAEEDDYPLTQFFFLPWLGRWLAQHRRETEAPRSWLAPLYRWRWFLWTDVAMHLVLKTLATRLRGAGWTKFFFRRMAPRLVTCDWRVVDWANEQLVMEHELFRHIEIELFVEASRVQEAASVIEEFLHAAAGDLSRVSETTLEQLAAAGLLPEVEDLAGQYLHRYPICFRKILPDDTLISMASGSEPWYSISLISYEGPDQREGFFAFARFIAKAAAALFDARCHWGKVNPHDAATIERLYPRLDEFREIARRYDPDRVFVNEWVEETLGLQDAGAKEKARPPARRAHSNDVQAKT